MLSVGVLLSTARFIAECFLSYQVAFCIFIPLFPWLQLAGLFYMLKLAERVIVEKMFGEQHLSGMDSAWLPEDSKNLFYLNSVFCFEYKGSVEERVDLFRQAIFERLANGKKANGDLLYFRMRCYFRPGLFQYFLREDRSFKIENHVLKWEGELPRSKEELEAIVSRLSTEPLPERRSPWCFVCIPTNFGSNDMFLAYRMSHALSDGISNMKLLIYSFPDEVVPQKEVQTFSTVNRTLFMAKAMLIAPRYLLKLLSSSADRSLIHGPDLSGVKNFVWDETLDLQLIKNIKSATGTTVNDVLMACMTMALRKYFQRKGVVSPADLTASVPVDVRPATKEIHFDNYFTFIFPKMAVGTGDIMEQLYETQARMKEFKGSGAPLVTVGMVYTSQEMCPRFLNNYLNTFITKKSSCAFSNLPGPQHMLTVKGSRMKYLMFFPPNKDNVGVSLAIFSYAGKVVVGIQSDIAVLPDPEIVVEEFGNAVNEMAKRVLHESGSS
ncbi:putative diacyglycerol O-acyltransferase MT1809 [Montipora capricornis]|uniref:putative diacyglycerol O-acyltransferase MT1809 n=1 Tax=Montipora capricornis TaxID=246305 RepID=UPI0035F1D397